MAGLSHQLLEFVMCACAKQPAAHTHAPRQQVRMHTYTTSTLIQTIYTHRTHTHMRTNMETHIRAQTHTHTYTHTHTPHVKTKAATHTQNAHTQARTHARAHNARQDKGSNTLAEVRSYVLNITDPPSTHALVRTHTHVHAQQQHSPR